MVFSTPVFMFCFLPLTLLVYYICPVRWRNLSLMLASLLFYFWGERLYVIIMLVSTLVDYTHGRIVERCKAKGNDRGAWMAVASSMILNLGILFFFKYWDFLAASLNRIGLTFVPLMGIHLPIGISFFTFQTMSYTIDVYRGDASAQKSLVNFGTFVTLFPQLVAGPIIRYKDLEHQLNERQESFDRFEQGVTIFVIGLSKKLLLANNLGQLWDVAKVSLSGGSLSVMGAWLGVLAYSFQIYFDFSGYSDMATGLGRMFGFEFPINFNYPYISESITEFWRRWHISLSMWFREYLYIPLGGNRKGRVRWYLNIFIVWAATGLWHGASWNYLFWGLYFCVILIFEKAFILKVLGKVPKIVRHLYTIFLLMIGWTIFGLEDFSMMGAYLKTMFGVAGNVTSVVAGGVSGTVIVGAAGAAVGSMAGAASEVVGNVAAAAGGMSRVAFADAAFFYYFWQYLPVLVIAAIASTPVMAKWFGRLKEHDMAIVSSSTGVKGIGCLKGHDTTRVFSSAGVKGFGRLKGHDTTRVSSSAGAKDFGRLKGHDTTRVSSSAGAKDFGRLKGHGSEILKIVLIVAGLISCTAYMVAGTYNPFLYFRF